MSKNGLLAWPTRYSAAVKIKEAGLRFISIDTRTFGFGDNQAKARTFSGSCIKMQIPDMQILVLKTLPQR